MRTIAVTDPVILLRTALDRLAEADTADLGDAALLDRCRQLARQLRRGDALLTRDIAAIHASGAAKVDGFGSTAAFLRGRLHLNTRDAATRIRVATNLARLPDTAAAYQAGDIDLGHAAAICATGKDLGPQIMAAGAEKLLLAQAEQGCAGTVWRLGHQIRERLLPDDEQARQAKLIADRWLRVDRTFHGTVSIQGVLDPVTGEQFIATLNRYTAPPPSTTNAGAGVDVPADARTPGQRRVDALADICRAANTDRGTAQPADTDNPTSNAGLHASTGGSNGPVGQVMVTVDLATLQQAIGHDAGQLGPAGTPIGAETARRIACDAQLIPAVLGSASEPLDIGRATRTVPTGIRRALRLRDHGCRFPLCDRPSRHTDAHHLHHWARGGPTSIRNLVELCGWHHTLVHEGGWSIAYNPKTNTVTASQPDGTRHGFARQPRGQPP